MAPNGALATTQALWREEREMDGMEMKVLTGVCFIPFALLLLRWAWNMSGIPGWEVRIIREDFHGCDEFLKPAVLAANSPFRCFLRVMGLLLASGALITPLFLLDLAWSEWVWALGGLMFLEMIIIRSVAVVNKRKYRRDLEECRLFTHPGVKRLRGSLVDRSDPPFRGSHLVAGGRLLVVLPTDDREEQVKLFLPTQYYGQRPVEEAEDVAVFYQLWQEAGLVRGPDHTAVGVYVGFRRTFRPGSEFQENLLRSLTQTEQSDGFFLSGSP